MIQILLSESSVTSILETLKNNMEDFDGIYVQAEDLAFLTRKENGYDIKKVSWNFALFTLKSEEEYQWFIKGYTEGFESEVNPVTFFMSRIKWGENFEN